MAIKRSSVKVMHSICVLQASVEPRAFNACIHEERSKADYSKRRELTYTK